MNFQTPVQQLKGVGERRAQLLKKLGVSTVGALLQLYPRQYEDWSQVVRIANAPFDSPCCIAASPIEEVREHRVRRGMTLYQVAVSDGESRMHVTIFNNRFAAQKLKVGESFLFFGKVGGTLTRREMSAPLIEPADGGERIRPIYPQTAGLKSRIIERTIKQVLDQTAEDLQDPLPEWLRESHRLCHRRFALCQIHFPSSKENLNIAKRRLVFEELFFLQMGMLRLKGRNQALAGWKPKNPDLDAFWSRLPFSPTGAQRRVAEECVADMQSGVPMNRLLQGDVGSGKTAVAAALCEVAARGRAQTAFMAPTEILATQHFESLTKLFEGTPVRVVLLTGSMTQKEKTAVRKELEEGQWDIAVGTHALLTESVRFRRLGLVITDEQHRFGVAQRTALSEKGDHPHILVMSATPIPRSLALIVYGDLDVSVLDEMPPGRTPVQTYTVDSSYRERIYRFLQKQLNAGRQGYIVCPLVEESESDLVSAQTYAQQLQEGAFRRYRVGLIHGKLPAKEKEAVMEAFHRGEIQVLVSTTVVEVGVDVPNATVMVIENAERFGLSQLHQLRGRVGRGNQESYCVLVSDAQNPEAVQRLKVMHDTTDGFRIADADLKQRGPGDFFGVRQHGLPTMRIANLMEDMETLQEARTAALECFQKDPRLELPQHAQLREQIEAFFSQATL